MNESRARMDNEQRMQSRDRPTDASAYRYARTYVRNTDRSGMRDGRATDRQDSHASDAPTDGPADYASECLKMTRTNSPSISLTCMSCWSGTDAHRRSFVFVVDRSMTEIDGPGPSVTQIHPAIDIRPNKKHPPITSVSRNERFLADRHTTKYRYNVENGRIGP